MSKYLIVLGVIAISAAACRPRPANTGAEPTGTATPSVTVMLPAGDVKAGRQAFMDLKCTACHAVPSEADFPPPISANPGPPMDARLARRDVSYLAAAIVSPSHEISPNISGEVRARLDGVLSPMGDFSHAMTVRQLVDLHAYLRSIE
jgi:Cytochrome c